MKSAVLPNWRERWGQMYVARVLSAVVAGVLTPAKRRNAGGGTTPGITGGHFGRTRRHVRPILGVDAGFDAVVNVVRQFGP